jgi:hypothetical protein
LIALRSISSALEVSHELAWFRSPSPLLLMAPSDPLILVIDPQCAEFFRTSVGKMTNTCAETGPRAGEQLLNDGKIQDRSTTHG